jgi:hypothetical protein
VKKEINQKRVGHPEVPVELQRRRCVSAWLTDSELEQVREVVKKSGCTQSTWARALLLKEVALVAENVKAEKT